MMRELTVGVIGITLIFLGFVIFSWAHQDMDSITNNIRSYRFHDSGEDFFVPAFIYLTSLSCFIVGITMAGISLRDIISRNDGCC